MSQQISDNSICSAANYSLVLHITLIQIYGKGFVSIKDGFQMFQMSSALKTGKCSQSDPNIQITFFLTECYYQHTSRESVSPVRLIFCAILYIQRISPPEESWTLFIKKNCFQKGLVTNVQTIMTVTGSLWTISNPINLAKKTNVFQKTQQRFQQHSFCICVFAAAFLASVFSASAFLHLHFCSCVFSIGFFSICVFATSN